MDETQQEQSNSRELLFEYEQLRKEILQNDAINLQIMGGTAVLVTAILGATFTETVQAATGKGFLVYTATIIVLLGISQLIDRHRTIFRTASYLRVFTESALRFVKWETRLSRLRCLSPHVEGFGFTSSYQLATYGVLAVFTYILGTIYIIQDMRSSPELITFISGPIILGVTTAWILYGTWRGHQKYILNHAKTFDPLWQKIKAEEYDE